MKDIQILIGTRCPTCSGYGNTAHVWGNETVPKCLSCKGTGWIDIPRLLSLKDAVRDADFQAGLKKERLGI